MGNKMSSDKTRADFNNAGFVFSTKVGNVTPLRYVNFGFNYQRVKSFYNNMQMEGNLGDFSQTIYMANQASDAGGIKDWPDNPYRDNNIGWLSAMGYNGYLITDLISQGDLDNLLASNPNYSNYVPYMKDGVQVQTWMKN